MLIHISRGLVQVGPALRKRAHLEEHMRDVHIDICIYIYIYAYIHTYIHTHIHTYKHTYIHTYTHTYTHIHTYTPRDYMHALMDSPDGANTRIKLPAADFHRAQDFSGMQSWIAFLRSSDTRQKTWLFVQILNRSKASLLDK